MLYSELKEQINEVRKEIENDIRDIDCTIPNVAPINGSVIACSVKLSELSHHNVWNPHFYSGNAQMDKILEISTKAPSLEDFVKLINKIVSSKKLPDGDRIHPIIIERLQFVLKKHDCLTE